MPLLLLFLLVLLPSHAETAPQLINLTLDLAQPGRAVPADFAGFSFEWRRFPFPENGAPSEVHPLYLQLLRNLAVFNDRGFNLRIGGASADGIKEVPDADRWAQIAQVYAATRTPLILNLNLAKGDVELDRAWIQAAQAQLPAGAIGHFELGHEPDGWFGRHKPKDYSFAQYFADFYAMASQLVSAVGAHVAGSAWAHGLRKEILEPLLAQNPHTLGLLTGHAYGFAPAVVAHPEKILLEEPITKVVSFLTPGITGAHAAGLKFRLGETGRAWGGGVAGFSDSFAAALWTMDFCCSLAEAGLDGINFHGGGKSHYSAIQDDVDDPKHLTKSIIVKAPYYGLLVFSEAMAHQAQLLSIPQPTDSLMRLWAMRDVTGTSRILVINKHPEQPVTLTLHLSGEKKARLRLLTAPSMASTDGIRWAGQTFDNTADGHPTGALQEEALTATEGSFPIQLSAVSAGLFTLP